ncbi:hypothetical protein A2U01_0001393 [Trifolium medium]|uniref:Uncharacterized protein n=1 Tax=Trifolium medium TaxID=97028 RepID=A0A392M044_9FABA|nr:hypothetical protein [Trifolium medium]
MDSDEEDFVPEISGGDDDGSDSSFNSDFWYASHSDDHVNWYDQNSEDENWQNWEDEDVEVDEDVEAEEVNEHVDEAPLPAVDEAPLPEAPLPDLAEPVAEPMPGDIAGNVAVNEHVDEAPLPAVDEAPLHDLAEPVAEPMPGDIAGNVAGNVAGNELGPLGHAWDPNQFLDGDEQYDADYEKNDETDSDSDSEGAGEIVKTLATKKRSRAIEGDEDSQIKKKAAK